MSKIYACVYCLSLYLNGLVSFSKKAIFSVSAFFAISTVKVIVILFFFFRGGNVDCRTKKGCSPFFLACKEGHLEIARSLYENSADIEVG